MPPCRKKQKVSSDDFYTAPSSQTRELSLRNEKEVVIEFNYKFAALNGTVMARDFFGKGFSKEAFYKYKKITGVHFFSSALLFFFALFFRLI
jgi:hypothetical protein